MSTFDEYRSLYASMSLELPRSAAAEKPTDLRIADAGTSNDPSLAALYLQFARYLLISSSRPGCQPANLQGIWNEGIKSALGQQVHDQHQHGDELLACRSCGPGPVCRAAAPDGGRPRRHRSTNCEDDVRRARLGRSPQHRSLARDGTHRRPTLGTLAVRRRVAL